MPAGRCNQCGAAIPSDADTLGLCPVCLIRRAMGKGASRGFEPPSVEEVQAELGQLDVLELVGFGGMGVVYKARQRSLDRLVAVKVFPREMWEDESFESRFRTEARLLASLSHPHIVTAHEYGETDAYYYLLMELVRGRSLRQVLREGRLAKQEAIRVAQEVCEALEYAHEQGVVHRDIKPENILLEQGAHGRVRVADFGLAKLIGAGEDAARIGTPEYMAPEQRERVDGVDQRADVYAVGVVLHEMLAGGLPAGNVMTSGAIGRIVRKCLSPDPADRYQQIAGLRKDLAALQSRRSRWLVPTSAAIVLLGIAAAFWWNPRAIQKRDAAAWPDPVARAKERAASYAASRPAWVPGPPVNMGPTGPVTTFHLQGVTEESAVHVIHHLRGLGAKGVWTASSGDRMTVMVTPAADVKGWAAKVDFGYVVKADEANQTIEVRVDPARLPKVPAPVTNPNDPAYYARNLEDLRSRDVQRRREALGRLRRVDATPLAGDVRKALADVVMTETDYFLRRDAIQGLAEWGGTEAVTALEASMWDDHSGVRREALKALEKVGEAEIARLLANPDRSVRLRAIRVLKEIGTARSLIPLGEAAGSGDQDLEREAEAAIRQIDKRIDSR